MQRRRHALVLVVTALAVVGSASPAVASGVAQAVAETSEALLTWWKAMILGIVEGLTEYLPVSSTGHLLVASRFLDLPDEQGSAGLEAVNTYAIAIQFGAIVAVVGVFRRRFAQMIRGLAGRDPEGRHLLITVVIAFLPAAVAGVALDSTIEDALFGPWPIVVAWVLGGAAILALTRTGHLPRKGALDRGRTTTLSEITYRQAFVIGLAQCVALCPGTSRSLATIVGALLIGMAMPVAVEFSFLLGFATLSAATGYKLLTGGGTLVDEFGIVNPLVGALFALIAAVISIRWLIGYLGRHDLTVFAWYRFIAAAFTTLLLATSVI